MSLLLFLAGLLLTLFGTAVTLAFWVPRLVNRQKLKDILGPKYPIIYMVYVANGPLLIVLGLFLIVRFH